MRQERQVTGWLTAERAEVDEPFDSCFLSLLSAKKKLLKYANISSSHHTFRHVPNRSDMYASRQKQMLTQFHEIKNFLFTSSMSKWLQYSQNFSSQKPINESTVRCIDGNKDEHLRSKGRQISSGYCVCAPKIQNSHSICSHRQLQSQKKTIISFNLIACDLF